MLNIIETQPPARRQIAPATISQVIEENVQPLVRQIDREGLYPETAMRRLGLVGAYSHHVVGGAGGLTEAIATTSEVAATCLSTAFCMWCQNTLAW